MPTTNTVIINGGVSVLYTIIDDGEEIEIELEIEDIELDEDTEIIIEDDDDVDDDTPFMIVENMPALAQCKTMRGDERHQCTQMEIIKYVSKNTKYPPICKKRTQAGLGPLCNISPSRSRRLL